MAVQRTEFRIGNRLCLSGFRSAAVIHARKSKGLGKDCAFVTDGRFSGGSSGLSIGDVSPEAAEGGTIGLVESGDIIAIDIPNRRSA